MIWKVTLLCVSANALRLRDPSKVIIPIGQAKLPTAPAPSPATTDTGSHSDNTFSEAARDSLKEKHSAAVSHELALQNRINSESEEKKHIMDMELKDAQAEKSRAEKEKADVTHKLHMMEEKDRHDEKEMQEKTKAESKEISAEKQNLEDQVSDLSGESIALGEALSKEREDVEKEAMEGEEKLKEEEEAENSNIEESVANSKNKAAKRDALTDPDSPCTNSEPEKAAEKAQKAIVEEADHLEKQQKIEECAPLGPIAVADKPKLKPGLESQEPILGPDGKPLKGPDGRVVYKKKGAADGDVDCLPPPPLVAAEKPEGEMAATPEGQAEAENPAPNGEANGEGQLPEEEKLPEEEAAASEEAPAEASEEAPAEAAEEPAEAAEEPAEAAEEPAEAAAEGDSLLTTGFKKLTNQTPLQ